MRIYAEDLAELTRNTGLVSDFKAQLNGRKYMILTPESLHDMQIDWSIVFESAIKRNWLTYIDIMLSIFVKSKAYKHDVKKIANVFAKYGQFDLSERVLRAFMIEPSRLCMKYAVRHGELEFMKKFTGRDNEYGREDIDIAVHNGHIEVVKYLLTLETIVPNQYSLSNAIASWRINMVMALLEKVKPSDISIKAAIKSGRIDILHLLIDHGAIVTDSHIDLAIYYDRKDLIEFLERQVS